MEYIRPIWITEKTHLSKDYPAHYYGAANFKVYVIYARQSKVPSNINKLEFVLASVDEIAYDFKEWKCYDLCPRKKGATVYNELIEEQKQKISIIKTFPNVINYKEAENLLNKYITDDMEKHEKIFRTKPPILSSNGRLLTTSFLKDPYTISSEYGNNGRYTLHKMDREEIEAFFYDDFNISKIAKQLDIEKHDVYKIVDNENIYLLARKIEERGYNTEAELRIGLKRALQSYDAVRYFAKVGDKWQIIMTSGSRDFMGNESSELLEFAQPMEESLILGSFDSEKVLLEALHDFIYSIQDITRYNVCENWENNPSEFINYSVNETEEDYYNAMTDGQFDDYDEFKERGDTRDDIDIGIGH